MSLFAFPVYRRKPIYVFVIAVLVTGFLRLGLSLAGVPDGITTYFSMTGVIFAAVLYFGFTSSGWKEMVVASYAVILTYTLVAIIALGYSILTGQHTIFQRAEHTLGMNTVWHLAAMVGGGVTTEPWGIFGLIWLIAWIRTFIRRRLQQAPGSSSAEAGI